MFNLNSYQPSAFKWWGLKVLLLCVMSLFQWVLTVASNFVRQASIKLRMMFYNKVLQHQHHYCLKHQKYSLHTLDWIFWWSILLKVKSSFNFWCWLKEPSSIVNCNSWLFFYFLFIVVCLICLCGFQEIKESLAKIKETQYMEETT